MATTKTTKIKMMNDLIVVIMATNNDHNDATRWAFDPVWNSYQFLQYKKYLLRQSGIFSKMLNMLVFYMPMISAWQ